MNKTAVLYKAINFSMWPNYYRLHARIIKIKN